MSEMASHWSFGHLQPKLWAKEKPRVKLPVWLPTTKSRESTFSRYPNLECDKALESSGRGLQVWFRPRPDRRSSREVTMPQSPKNPKPRQFRDSTLGVPGQTTTWVWVWRSNAKNTIGRMVMTSPEPGPWCVMWVRVSPWLVPTPKACRMNSNQLVLVCMQVRDQIAWSLPRLIPGLLARPSTPFSVGSWERPQSPNFPQLYIVEPSSGFNKGLRSTLILLFLKWIWNFEEEFFFFFLQVFDCRNPNLGFTTKVKACKSTGRKGSLRVWKWTLTLPSELPFWELES
jgi:hypothetical protein